MTEIEIIKELFKATSAKTVITVVMNDNTTYTGIIQMFDGDKIFIENNEIPLSSITGLEYPRMYAPVAVQDSSCAERNDFYTFKGEKVHITTTDSISFEGIVFDIIENKVILVATYKKEVLDISSIADIRIIHDDNQGNTETGSEFAISAFEQAVIDGDKEAVDSYLRDPARLMELGFNEEEALRMSKLINTPLPWNDDENTKLYNSARRIYSYVGNRGGLAQRLFEEFLHLEKIPYKLKCKAINALIEIHSKHNDNKIERLYDTYANIILTNETLRYYAVKAFIKMKLFDKARMIVDKSGEEHFSSILLELNYYEKNRSYDISRLPGLNALSPQISVKELRNLIALPDRTAFVNLLTAYSKSNRFESFFALLDLFMPYAKCDSRVVELVLYCLTKDDEGEYIIRFLPEFPTLWLNKGLANRYLLIVSEAINIDKRSKRLISQCKRTSMFAEPNELENSIINGNFQLFDVMRGNDAILFSMGYSPEETERIKKFDVDSIKYGDKTAFERIYLFQKNRNMIAESISGFDFLKTPETVGQVLLPMLLEEGNYDLLYEIFNYSSTINKQLSSAKIIYLRALLCLNEREEFWSQISCDWTSLDLDKEMLIVGRDLAREHGRQDLSAAMSIRSEYGAFNDFELAVIEGSVPALRSFATDAELLLSAGYSTEDIKLIQENLRQRVNLSSSDNRSIANRLYSFQKNKHRAAEFYYLLSLKDDNLAAVGLFAILQNEKRYSELCELFEEHLYNAALAESTSIKESYLNALYYTEQYAKYKEYWITISNEITVNPLELLIVYIKTDAPASEIKALLVAEDTIQNDDILLANDCLACISERYDKLSDIEENINSFVISVFNRSFPYCNNAMLSQFASIIKKMKCNDLKVPEGIGVLALAKYDISSLDIENWCEYLFEIFQGNAERIAVIRNIVETYSETIDLYSFVHKTIISMSTHGILIPDDLSSFLIPRFECESDQIKWLDERLITACSETNEIEFDIFCQLAKELNEKERLYKYLQTISEHQLIFAPKFIKLVVSLLSEEIGVNTDNTNILLSSIENQMKYLILDVEDLTVLFRAYLYTDNRNYAFLTNSVINDRKTSETNYHDLAEELCTGFKNMGNVSFFSIVKQFLSLDSLHDITQLAYVWQQNLQITESDIAALSEIKDYYSMPDKWSENSLNALAKHLLCNISSPLYWELLNIVFSDSIDSICCNIQFHLAVYKKSYLDTLLINYAMMNLQNQSIEIIISILNESSVILFEHDYYSISVVYDIHPEWFKSRDVAIKVINAAYNNSSLKGDLRTWIKCSDIAMQIALAGSAEKEFFELYKDNLKSELAIINEKLLCACALEKSESIELIGDLFDILQDSSAALPLRNIIADIFGNTPSLDFTEVQLDILTIARCNNGETLDEMTLYEYYVMSVSNGKETIASKVLKVIGTYYPELTAIKDIEKYELIANGATDDEILHIYNTELDSLKKEVKPEKAEKVIINMIPGELYLRAHRYEIESVIALCASISGNQKSDLINKRLDECNALNRIFSPLQYPELASIILRCTFIRKWNDFIIYNPGDPTINTIIKNDIIIKEILKLKSFEILKSAVLEILNSVPENQEIIDRVEAIFIANGRLKHSKDVLRKIQGMDSHEKEILRKVFNVRIESKTLRVSGIAGSTILRITGNEHVALAIGLLSVRHLAELFDNDKCLHTLMHMSVDASKSIANVYSSFFSSNSKTVFKRIIDLQDSRKLLREIVNNPFEETIDYCKLARSRFQASKIGVESAAQPLPKQLIKKHEQNKAAFLYEAIIHDSTDDVHLISPTEIDYLTTVTHLFNTGAINDIRNYIWHVDNSFLIPFYAMVQILLEQYSNAYETALQIESPTWKNAIFQIMYRDLKCCHGVVERNIKYTIQQEINVVKKYFIGRFFPVNNEQTPIFIKKMKDLRSFIEELVEYMRFSGIELVYKPVDDNAFQAMLEHYAHRGNKIQKQINVIEPESTIIESVSDILSNELIIKLITESPCITASICSKKVPDYNDCIAGLKYYAENKAESYNRQEILQARNLARWLFIRSMDKSGFDRVSLNQVLSLVSAEDSIIKAQWDAIASYIIVYFENISDIAQLSRIVENDISALSNVRHITNTQIRLLRNEDIMSWNLIVGVLTTIAGIDFSRMAESEQIDKLSNCRQLLIRDTENKSSTIFNRVITELLRLLTNHIMILRHNPELALYIVGEQPDGFQFITWEVKNTTGTLYAVISNLGGADCQNVMLTSTVNMTRIRHFTIQTVLSGEKIPFSESFDCNDLTDGQLSWNIEVSYYDSVKRRTISFMHESKAIVRIGGEALNPGSIATGNPARGKNFIGRKRELTLLHNRYSEIEQLPSTLIRGLKRSGKSSILIQFTEESRKRDKYIVALVDGQSIGGHIKRAFIDKVIDDIYAAYKSKNQYSAIFENSFEGFRSSWKSKEDENDWIAVLDSFYFELSHLFGKKILIIIDEMEAIFYSHRFESIDEEESLYAAIRALIQKPNNCVSFIFCGSDKLLTSCLEQKRESQMFQTLQYLEVGRMNHNDISEIFRQQSEKYDIKFSSDSIDAIWQYTHGLVWYAKLLGYLVINNIFANDTTIRAEVNRADIVTAVQMLINGEIGTDKYDLVDASLTPGRKALIHAMASVMPVQNKELTVDEICAALKMLQIEGYKDPISGAMIKDIQEKEVRANLEFLEKMQLVDSNASHTKYQFAAELYRLFFRNDKRLHLFEEII